MSKKKHKPYRPTMVCVMSQQQAKAVRHAVTIGHKCCSKRHPHFRRELVNAMEAAGDIEWFNPLGRNPIAVWVEHKIWAKTISEDRQKGKRGKVATMQLVEPADVYARRKR